MDNLLWEFFSISVGLGFDLKKRAGKWDLERIWIGKWDQELGTFLQDPLQNYATRPKIARLGMSVLCSNFFQYALHASHKKVQKGFQDILLILLQNISITKSYYQHYSLKVIHETDSGCYGLSLVFQFVFTSIQLILDQFSNLSAVFLFSY